MADIATLLGKTFVCRACGRTHSVTLREMLVADDALERLPDLCRRHMTGARVTLVADLRTRAAAGGETAEALRRAGFRVDELVLPDPAPGHSPVCDDHTRAWLEARLPPADLMLAVGSGVVSDLVKWIAGDRRLPYIAVATAASMNGYASSNIAPTIRGVKRLLYGSGPVAVVAVPQILQNAPATMTAAGLGDVLAKPISSADWRLNRLLFGEFACDFCMALIDKIEPLYTAEPEKLAPPCDRDAIGALFDALVLTGLSMSMAETSAPASGGEHLISHTLDMMSMLDGTPHDLHGRQVGLGTIIGAALYEEVLANERPTFAESATPTDPRFWGRFADEVEAEHAQKRVKAARAVAALQANPALWASIRADLRPKLRSPHAVKECLRRAGAAHRLGDIGIGRERFLAALLHAHQIRERYTILDLARAVGVLPQRAEALVERWL